MKKIIFSILFLLFAFSLRAQVYQKNYQYGFEYQRLKADSALSLPRWAGKLPVNQDSIGLIFFNPADSNLTFHNGKKLIELSKVTDTLPLHAQILARWDSMTIKAIGYLLPKDTVSHWAPLGSYAPAFTVTSPITYSGNIIGIPQAGVSTNGYLSSTDWNTFNNKQPAGSYQPLENQRLSTTNDVLFNSTTANGQFRTGLNAPIGGIGLLVGTSSSSQDFFGGRYSSGNNILLSNARPILNADSVYESIAADPAMAIELDYSTGNLLKYTAPASRVGNIFANFWTTKDTMATQAWSRGQLGSYALTNGSNATGSWPINAASLSAILSSTLGGSGVNNAGTLTWGAGGTLGSAAYYSVTKVPVANEIPLFDSSEHLYVNYISSNTPNNENSGVNQFIITDGVDNFYRKVSISIVQTALGLGSNAYTSTAYLPLAGGTLIGSLTGTTGSFSGNISASNITVNDSLSRGYFKANRTSFNSETGYQWLNLGITKWWNYMVSQDTSYSLKWYSNRGGIVMSLDQFGNLVTVNNITDGGLLSAPFVATNSSGTFTAAAYTPYNPASYPVNAGGETLQSVTNRGTTTTLGITALKFITSGGTSSQFVKGDGSLDGTAYTPTNGTGATGTWGISITGNAATATNSTQWNGATNAISTPTSGQILQYNGTNWVNAAAPATGVTTFSAGTTGLTPSTATSGAVTLAGTLALANGGTGQTTAQAAINSLAGAVTSGYYLRGNGTNVAMAAISAGDVPTLNQNTTGSAGSVVNALTLGTDLSGGSYNGSAIVTVNNTSTLASVTGRGATTTTALTLARTTLTDSLVGVSAKFTGTITAAGGFYNSDLRLKTLIERKDTINPLLLRMITFHWKPWFSADTTRVHYGNAAQEVKLIYPDLVNTDGRGYETVNYTELHTLQIYQLKKENEELREKVDKQQQEIDAIKSKLGMK